MPPINFKHICMEIYCGEYVMTVTWIVLGNTQGYTLYRHDINPLKYLFSILVVRKMSSKIILSLYRAPSCNIIISWA